MARGSKIHPDVHYIVIRLSSIMKPDDIAIYTGISKQSVLRILRYFAHHGTVEDKKERKPSKEIRVDDMREAIQFAQRTSGRGRGKAVLVISHDERYFGMADRVVRLDYGKLTSEAPAHAPAASA